MSCCLVGGGGSGEPSGAEVAHARPAGARDPFDGNGDQALQRAVRLVGRHVGRQGAHGLCHVVQIHLGNGPDDLAVPVECLRALHLISLFSCLVGSDPRSVCADQPAATPCGAPFRGYGVEWSPWKGRMTSRAT